MEPNPDHIAVLEKFAWGEISLARLEAALTEMTRSPVRLNPLMRAFGVGRLCLARRIRITRAHLERVLQQRRDGQMSDRDLVDWATMATINDAYYWDTDDGVLTEWIGRLHLDTFPEPSTTGG